MKANISRHRMTTSFCNTAKTAAHIKVKSYVFYLSTESFIKNNINNLPW